MCLSVYHSPSQRLHIRMFFWQLCKWERGRKRVPKLRRRDLTSLVRHHKLFVVCSSLKDWGSSQVDGDRCWRTCRGTGWGVGKCGEVKDREFQHLCLLIHGISLLDFFWRRRLQSNGWPFPAEDCSGSTRSRQKELLEVRLICKFVHNDS